MWLTGLCRVEEASPALALATFQQSRVFRDVRERNRGCHCSWLLHRRWRVGAFASWGCCTNSTHWDLKQQESLVSQFWRPEVWNHGVNRFVLSVKSVGENPSLPLLAPVFCQQSLACLTYRCISAVSLRPPPQVIVSLCVLTSCYKDTSHTGSGSPCDLNLMMPANTLFLNKVTSTMA